MNKSILFLMALCSMSAYGQSTLLGVTETKNVFAQMANEQSADLSLRNKVGSCKAIQLGSSGARFMYSLSYMDGGKKVTERFGKLTFIQSMPKSQFLQLNQAVQMNLTTKIMNLFGIPQAHAQMQALQLPMYAIPYYAKADLLSAKGQLGQRVKQLVASNKCGSVNFESFQRSLPDMQNDVTFYMENNVLTCTAADFEKKVRQPNSCNYISVHSALPKEACKLLYQIQSTKSGRNVSSGTAAAPSAPSIAVMSATTRMHLQIDQLLNDSPDIAIVAEAAQFIKAEHVVPTSVIELLENQTITSANFDNNSLSSTQKAELVNLVATHDAIKNSSDHVQFSADIVSTINSIRTKANSYALTASLSPEIWAVPTRAAIGVHLDSQLAPLSTIVGTAFVYNIQCLNIESVSFAKAASASL
jgi:hypothetical protein